MQGPVRTCVGCGEAAPASDLVRLVLDGVRVIPGTPGRGGRGAWVHATEACVDRAVRRRAFARAFRCRDAAAVDAAAVRLLLTGSVRKN